MKKGNWWKLVVTLIVIMVAVPSAKPVFGADIVCSQMINATYPVLECAIPGSPIENVKVKLKSFNGVPVHVKLSGTKLVNGQEVQVNPEKEFVEVPFSISLGLNSPIEQFMDYLYLNSSNKWILYNKVSTLTFELSYPNGTAKETQVGVYISGKVPSPLSDRETRDFFSHLAFPYILLLLIVLAYQVYRFIRWNPLESGEREEKEDEEIPKLRNLRKSFAFSGLIGIGFGLSLLPWVLYLFATPPKMVSDVVLYIPITAMLGLVIEWEAFTSVVENSGKDYLLRTPPVTGIEWIPLVLLSFRGWVVLAGFFGYLATFALSMNRKLSRQLIKIAVIISPIAALLIIVCFTGDFTFIAGILLLSYLYPYLIKSKAETAPSLEEVQPVFRSPEVQEILETFDKVLRERED
ncbi:hypothetical protein [Thermococcus sp.]|uniref:hypothetical protein n=1 Tax=Thermococcus sp. TaxID=35749 RepID=UPI00261BA925|nr:hypothetical protein [Thermococcus sp.]